METEERREEGEDDCPEGDMTKEDVCEGDAPPTQRRVTHQVASAPMPSDCEFSFFDPSEPRCEEILQDPNTTIPELFAVLRQWVPQVQKNVHIIGREILKRGCGVNDRDGLTDMSLLHYCCKAGAPGIGDPEAAAGFARRLLALGADPSLRSRWTNMRPLHYAAYFDVPELIRVVLQASPPGDVDSTCSDFGFGTALHIAASNLCVSAVRCLLELGANPAFRNERGECPADSVPDPLEMPLDQAEAAGVAKELRGVLRGALPRPRSPPGLAPPPPPPPPGLSDRARLQMAALGLRLGDRVVIAGQKVGSLRFCGSTEFSGGLWAGVELDRPEGKNDGAVAGVPYFSCPPRHGIFAPLSKISKPLEKQKSGPAKTPVRPPRRIDLSRVTAKVNTETLQCRLDRLTSNSWGGVLSRSLSSSSSSLDSRPGPARPRPPPPAAPPPPGRGGPPAPGPRPPRGHAPHRTPPPPAPGFRSRTPSGGSSLGDGSEVRLGERVLVAGQRTGVVQFCGKTSFAPGVWLGVELDKPSGKNDGSVGGVRYFSCPPKHGVFAPPSRVQRIHGSVDCLSELSSSRLSHPLTGTIRRSSSTSSAIAAPKETSRRSPASRSRRWGSLSGVGGAAPGPKGPAPPGGRGLLGVGSQVFLGSLGEMAWVRYLGPAGFAPGLWLGLELSGPRGRNDGAVGGRRYFSCPPRHGVLVRPGRVTHRGVSGARLLGEG
ncbi:LOW QUALITY PROTEIN: CAP-Gly domain-containing linker protein 4-like [Menidia menidia]